MSDFSKIEQRLDKIESTMVSRDAFQGAMSKLHNEMNGFRGIMDQAMTILQRLDQERVFTMEWIRRIESDVERVKKQLHLN